jgi:hypothetical protein
MCATPAENFPLSDVPREAGALLRRWTDGQLLAAVVDPARPA